MKLKYGIAPVAMAALFVTACSTTDTTSTTTTTSSNTGYTMSSADKARIAKLEAENQRLRTASATRSTTSRIASDGRADLPPAKPGECYSRVLIPAAYNTVTERVVDVAASERIEIIPATYRTVTERVLVKEAGERLEVIPATYKNVTDVVTVEPARTELRTVPARYETKTERVLVREGYTTWKKGSGAIGGTLGGGKITDTREESTGEIMCLVEVPAEYRTVTKKVLVTAARTDKVTIPAKTKTVTKSVIATPATTRKVTIPAKYDTVTVRKLVTPATEKRIPVPATYKTVTKQKKVTDSKLVWREVLCETNTTPDVIRRVQTALNGKGFNVSVDGVLGQDTLRAVEAYQRRNGLGTGGLTLATVKHLGL